MANGVYAGPEEPLSPDVLSLYTMKNWLPFVFGASVSHRHRSRRVFGAREVLIGESVTRRAGTDLAGRAAGQLGGGGRVRIAALQHVDAAGHHPVALGVVEVARLRQVDERVDGAGGLAVQQVERDLALVGVDRGLVAVRVSQAWPAGGSPSSPPGWPTCSCSDVQARPRPWRWGSRWRRRSATCSPRAAGFLGFPLGRNTASREPTRAKASTPLSPISQRRRTCRCRTNRCSCWRRCRSLACLRWRSFLPATGRVLLGLSQLSATAGIHGRQADEPDAYL